MKIVWFFAMIIFVVVLFSLEKFVTFGSDLTRENLIEMGKEYGKKHLGQLILPSAKEKRIRIEGEKIILDYTEWS